MLRLILAPNEEQPTKQWVREALPDEIFGESYCRQWHSAIFGPDNWDPIVAFALLIFSSLKSVSIMYGGGRRYLTQPEYPYITEILRKTQSPPGLRKILPALRQVYLEPRSSETSDTGITFNSAIPYL